MERFVYGFAHHTCAPLSQDILIPVGLEKYNSKVIASARCQICGQTAFEKTLDRAHAASKGSYITA